MPFCVIYTTVQLRPSYVCVRKLAHDLSIDPSWALVGSLATRMILKLVD
jgi:hypothetical protein